MAFSYGRQFRRIAAQALTADPDEMRALIARILPARDGGAPPKLRVRSEADRQRTPAVIVAAFFADALTGDEAADLLRQTEDPAFRKQTPQEEPYPYPPWGPPMTSVERAETARPRGSAANEAGGVVKNNENTSAACCDAEDRIPEHPPP